ncbi:MAG: hypothetical protein U1E43_02025 [Rhodospirillales bacterium]
MGTFAEPRERLVPGHPRPSILDLAAGRPIDGGIERAEAAAVGRSIERRPQEQRGEGFGGGGIRQVLREEALAFQGGGGAGVMMPLDVPWWLVAMGLCCTTGGRSGASSAVKKTPAPSSTVTL